jgi:hypothetical protein
VFLCLQLAAVLFTVLSVAAAVAGVICLIQGQQVVQDVWTNTRGITSVVNKAVSTGGPFLNLCRSLTIQIALQLELEQVTSRPALASALLMNISAILVTVVNNSTNRSMQVSGQQHIQKQKLPGQWPTAPIEASRSGPTAQTEASRSGECWRRMEDSSAGLHGCIFIFLCVYTLYPQRRQWPIRALEKREDYTRLNNAGHLPHLPYMSSQS